MSWFADSLEDKLNKQSHTSKENHKLKHENSKKKIDHHQDDSDAEMETESASKHRIIITNNFDTLNTLIENP